MVTSTATRRLSEDQVRDILLSPDGNRVLARRYGISPQMISEIKRGRLYRDACPDVKRRSRKRSCFQCAHLRRGRDDRHRAYHYCGLDLPDMHEVGMGFAIECSVFLQQ
jgi:hypothetical protein